MRNLKLNKLTKVLALLSVMVLFLSTVNVPKADAATPTTPTTPTAGSTVTPAYVGPSITDNNPITVQLNTDSASFSIKVSDFNKRHISIMSDTNTPLKTVLKPVDTNLSNAISFNSVDCESDPNCNRGSMISWHFLPNTEYVLTVYPQTYPTKVTISMSPNESGTSWVCNNDGKTFTEKNMMNNGENEWYQMKFKTPGTYQITVDTNFSNLTAAFSDPVNSGNSETKPVHYQCTFTKTINADTAYGFVLYDGGNPIIGGASYTFTVKKIG